MPLVPPSLNERVVSSFYGRSYQMNAPHFESSVFSFLLTGLSTNKARESSLSECLLTTGERIEMMDSCLFQEK